MLRFLLLLVFSAHGTLLAHPMESGDIRGADLEFDPSLDKRSVFSKRRATTQTEHIRPSGRPATEKLRPANSRSPWLLLRSKHLTLVKLITLPDDEAIALVGESNLEYFKEVFSQSLEEDDDDDDDDDEDDDDDDDDDEDDDDDDSHDGNVEGPVPLAKSRSPWLLLRQNHINLLNLIRLPDDKAISLVGEKNLKYFKEVFQKSLDENDDDDDDDDDDDEA
eukprot:CAMPEP_0185745910 /NCGR_PEP_ID=MMETSP1174-20130828/4304_1 /TAXON_ID=35687 /ORGANISM="Dictyocha speculum, Strain CCMP1381" /LENGTH=220 /DNA_ID=CAMNT_0028420199 /DNA_START=12 /DNA_END=674 /DNA_ORIENTATION=+